MNCGGCRFRVIKEIRQKDVKLTRLRCKKNGMPLSEHNLKHEPPHDCPVDMEE